MRDKIRIIQNSIQRRNQLIIRPTSKNHTNRTIINHNHIRKLSQNKIISKPNHFFKSAVRHGPIINDVEYHKYMSKVSGIRNIGIGKRLLMIAPGPSILEIDLKALNNIRNLDTLTINKPDMRIWPTTYWSFCDHSQYLRNKDTFESFNGLIFNSGAVRARKDNQIIFKNMRNGKFSLDLTQGIDVGRSTTYASMQIALWMNYDKIYIIGCDMAKVGDMVHSYGRNPDVSEDTRVARFKGETQCYDNAASALSVDQRNKFYFCSSYNPWDFVNKFNKMDHINIIEHLIESDDHRYQK